jgi:hypothetical protein
MFRPSARLSFFVFALVRPMEARITTHPTPNQKLREQNTRACRRASFENFISPPSFFLLLRPIFTKRQISNPSSSQHLRIFLLLKQLLFD